MFRLCLWNLLIFFLLGVAPLANVAAQTWPSKPIRMIVPAPPGASTDVLARLAAQGLGERLGVSVIVDNRAGASGMIGTEAVARAIPDGYTLLFTQQDAQILLPILKKQLPYSADKDFVPIGKVGDIYLLFAVSSKVPATTIKEFISFAKSRPGDVKFSSGGAGGINHLVVELLKQRAGIDLLHIPYKGGAPATTALLAGEVDLFGGSPTLLAKLIDAGKIRGLAIAKETRSLLLPSVPTMAESGFADFIVSAWFGVFAPAGLPEDIAKKLSDAVVSLASSPDFQQRLATVGGEGTPLGREDFARFLVKESANWRQVIQRAGIQAED